jgi:hypothetical protein
MEIFKLLWNNEKKGLLHYYLLQTLFIIFIFKFLIQILVREGSKRKK